MHQSLDTEHKNKLDNIKGLMYVVYLPMYGFSSGNRRSGLGGNAEKQKSRTVHIRVWKDQLWVKSSQILMNKNLYQWLFDSKKLAYDSGQ